MTLKLMTSAQFEQLKTLAISIDTAFVPYDYVIKYQNYLCELDTECVCELLNMIEVIPHIRIIDSRRTGLRLRYASRTEQDSYLFLEVCTVARDRYYVTSFVDDLDYLMGYMPLEK